jgi:hypothetical protein
MPLEKILITVKTYPTLSRSHGELVCTAGLREDGRWIRIYPVPFRLLDYQNRYKKFDWIEGSFRRNTRDQRPESFRPNDASQIRAVDHMGTENSWAERRAFVLGRASVYDHMQHLVDLAHRNELSLAVFRPTRVLDFRWEETGREWDPERVEEIRSLADQGDLFGTENWRETLRFVDKLPYKFFYEFADQEGRRSKLQVLDWEAGQLYWNCLRNAEGDEELALQKVRQKYFDVFRETDLHFFLGTTLLYHRWAANPWLIIGVFPAPGLAPAVQSSLF